jgi:HEPN domain-containing protein
MKGLLYLAKADCKAAKLLSQGSADEAVIGYAAYHVEQAIEKTLKCLIELRGIQYPRIHDITFLVTEVQKLGIEVPDKLASNTYQITEWAVSTRYNINTLVALDAVKEFNAITLQWIKSIESSLK